MTGRAASTRRDREAADWFGKLSTERVSATDMEAFQKWRGDPACREAYSRVERAWMAAGTLAGDRDIQRALSSVPDRRRRQSTRSLRTVVVGSLIAATAVLAIGGYVFNQPTRYVTAVGERRIVVLSDGSRLQLDTDSRVDVAFRSGRRDLTLGRGQAMVDVAHDADRPFVVTVGKAQVQALGTRFNVRRDGGLAQVTLVEGRVEVRAKGGTVTGWTLQPGDQLLLPRKAKGGTSVQPRRVDVTATTSWTTGRLVFDAVPLATAVAEVNRYTDRPILLGPGVQPSSPISGTFGVRDPVAFADAVARIHGLRMTSEPGGTIVLGRSAL